MRKFNRPIGRNFVLATSLIVCSGLAWAQPPVNSVNTDQVIKGGVYANTIDGQTVFTNPHGLWLKSGTTVQGVALDNVGKDIGDGGTILLKAPNSVVRLDGTINVDGHYANRRFGYAGNVTIEAAYLYQSGNIFARNGNGGGTGAVTINVNSATFTPTASIDVSASRDNGGSIHINSTGGVDIQRNGSQMAQFNSSSLYNYAGEANLIDIHSGMVNNLGIIRADGIAKGPEAGAPRGDGGTIRLTASGCMNLQPVADALNHTTVFTPCQAKSIFDQFHSAVARFSPDLRNNVWNKGLISANGASSLSADDRPGHGGQIEMTGTGVTMGGDPGQPSGIVQANGGTGYDRGGDGGVIIAKASNVFYNAGAMSVNGGDAVGKSGSTGGQGGGIEVHSGIFHNLKTMSANGGNGAVEQGNGGNGGVLNLNADAKFSVINDNSGLLSATGGNGGGGTQSLGGEGGNVILVNISNRGTGKVNTAPGHP